MRFLARTECVSLPDHAFAQGYDHSAGWTLFMYAVFSTCFIFGLTIFGLGWFRGIVAAILCLLVALVFALLFRFKVAITSNSVSLSRSWLGMTYSRRTMGLDKTSFEVWGAGDWGDEGDWPASHYCEIEPGGSGNQDLRIGTPASADALHEFLTEQRERFLEYARNAQ